MIIAIIAGLIALSIIGAFAYINEHSNFEANESEWADEQETWVHEMLALPERPRPRPTPYGSRTP